MLWFLIAVIAIGSLAVIVNIIAIAALLWDRRPIRRSTTWTL